LFGIRTVPNVPDDERIPGLDDHATEEIPEEKEKESERARFKQKMSNLGVDASGRPLREGEELSHSPHTASLFVRTRP
jgi:hypothetical protein